VEQKDYPQANLGMFSRKEVLQDREWWTAVQHIMACGSLFMAYCSTAFSSL